MMANKFLIVIAFCLTVVRANSPYVGLNVPPLGNDRIVGGAEAVKGEFPHQVSLQWGLPPIISPNHFCGGSIINSRWILTAGHCVRAVPSYGSFIVKAGKHAIKINEIGEQSVRVNATFVHKNYAGGVAPFDIALVKLSSPLFLNKAVASVSLPKFGKIPTGNTILSGWGSISSNSSAVMPPTLQTAILPIVNINACKIAIEKLTGPSVLHSTNICTGPLTGGFSACNGDSGGPLILRNSKGHSELVGIVSWGILPCGTKGAPSVYTRVSAFVDWIQLTIANN